MWCVLHCVPRFVDSFRVNANSTTHKEALKKAAAGLIEAVNLEPVSSTDLHWHGVGCQLTH